MHVERTFTVPTPDRDGLRLPRRLHAHQRRGTRAPSRPAATSGDGGVGTTYANTSEFMGRRTELTYETHHPRAPRPGCSSGARNKTATATDTLTFTPAGDGTSTQIHYRADFEFAFPISLVAPLLVKPKLAKLADETVEQMPQSRTSLGRRLTVEHLFDYVLASAGWTSSRPSSPPTVPTRPTSTTSRARAPAADPGRLGRRTAAAGCPRPTTSSRRSSATCRGGPSAGRCTTGSSTYPAWCTPT